MELKGKVIGLKVYTQHLMIGDAFSLTLPFVFGCRYKQIDINTTPYD